MVIVSGVYVWSLTASAPHSLATRTRRTASSNCWLWFADSSAITYTGCPAPIRRERISNGRIVYHPAGRQPTVVPPAQGSVGGQPGSFRVTVGLRSSTGRLRPHTAGTVGTTGDTRPDHIGEIA